MSFEALGFVKDGMKLSAGFKVSSWTKITQGFLAYLPIEIVDLLIEIVDFPIEIVDLPIEIVDLPIEIVDLPGLVMSK